MENASFGIVLLSDPKVFAKLADDGFVFLLPSPLRLVRTTRGDNGFSGVRTITYSKSFYACLKVEAMEAEGKEITPDVLGELQNAGPDEAEVLDTLGPNDYRVVSERGTAKWLACHPRSKFALTTVGGTRYLCPMVTDTVLSMFKKNSKQVVTSSFASFV